MKRILWGSLAVIFLLAWSLEVWGQETAFWQAPAEAATVGDLIPLTLTSSHQAEYRLVPLQLGREWGPFEVRELSDVSREARGEGWLSRQTVWVTAWQAGVYETPPLTITLSTATGEVVEVTVAGTEVEVASLLTGQGDQLQDIKPPVSLPQPSQLVWFLLGLGLVLLGAGMGLWWYQRQEVSEAAPVVAAADNRPPYGRALAALAAAEGEVPPIEDGEGIDAYYVRIGEIVRRYLISSYMLSGEELTTTDLVAALELRRVDREGTRLVRSFLSELDWVKFANVRPSAEDVAQLPAYGRQVVMTVERILVAAKEKEMDEVVDETAVIETAVIKPDGVDTASAPTSEEE